ncbi:PH domain-containing protein [Intrasporangium calvum]|uniref:PH domain-containing protein n=1 Tax=Intrasporangium calvum TaxID=53358 RepID=A0ABT5GJY6_9MICO|nr:PH domain-containing protein [Intrasporangium calvum]MDC5698511.1 PH domain-containing protein [Intrasporangium calvum]
MRAGGTSPTDPHRPGSVDQRSVVTLRPGSSIAIGAFGAVAGLALLLPALRGPDRDWVVISSIVLALVLLWLFVVRPCAQLGPDGIRLVNPLRVVDLTWPVIEEVRSRWALELVSAGRRYTAWGVPADPGRPRHGRSTVAPPEGWSGSGSAPSAGRRPKAEAQTVAEEIERRIAADRCRPAAARTGAPRTDVQSWDAPAVAMLVGAAAFFVVTVLAL